MVRADKELGQTGVDIRVWTGDTMTAASVYQQLVALPDLKSLFYIGANGKIGTAFLPVPSRPSPLLSSPPISSSLLY